MESRVLYYKGQNFRQFKPKLWNITWTTDAQRGNSLHCMAENSIPIPNF